MKQLIHHYSILVIFANRELEQKLLPFNFQVEFTCLSITHKRKKLDILIKRTYLWKLLTDTYLLGWMNSIKTQFIEPWFVICIKNWNLGFHINNITILSTLIIFEVMKRFTAHCKFFEQHLGRKQIVSGSITLNRFIFVFKKESYFIS